MAPRLSPLLDPPIGFARRGAMAHADENTLEAFRLALKLGATGIESEPRITADGVVVLTSETRVGSRLRGRRIVDVEARAVPDHIPTLVALYEIVGPEFPISLDLRAVDATGGFEAVVATARAVGGAAERNLWLSHPEIDVLMSWRPRTEARLVNSAAMKSLPGGPERRAAELQELGVDAMSLFHREWSGGLVALLHRFDRLAIGWGATHEREIAKLLDSGIDAVHAEHVDRLAAVIAAFYDD